MVARPAEERRVALFNNNYRIYFSDGRTERRALQTTEELASVLQNDFEINLPDGWEPILDQLLQRK
jgi:arylamine N-acetyltransferase